jgi:RNA polymerase sigma-70 factor (ECF subfamily)
MSRDSKSISMGQGVRNSLPLERDLESGWVAASQRGDNRAFNQLVLKWEKHIFNLTLRMLHDPDEAEDTTQEVFLAAFRNIRRFRKDARFSTWLYRIAVNHCLSRLRKRPTEVHVSLDMERGEERALCRLPSSASHEREILSEERQSHVRLALQFLQPEHRVVVELKFFHDLTFEEIAAVVEAPVSTIKSRLYAGLEVMRFRLGAFAPDI